MEQLESKTAIGFIYKLFERIGAKGIYFLISILLARILFPSEYGIISLVMVFIELSEVFVSYGFGNALVVFQDSDDVDFSTCLYFCLFLSAILYLCLWFLSDYIAAFFDEYDSCLLSTLIKVLGVRIPIGAINTVQHAFIKKHMLFKKFFFATLFGTILSGAIAVIMAYKGMGVWALAEQYLGNIVIDSVFVGLIIEWHPKLVFSFVKLKRLFGYGWKLLIVGLIDTGYANMRNLVVGKKYSSSDLAYYSKGTTIARTGVSVFEETISEVFFSAISNCNDDKKEMIDISRKVIRVSSFLIFPIIIGVGSVGRDLIIWLLTEKWLPALVFLEIGCLAFLFRPIQIINSCIIGASGKSNLLLASDIINKVLGIILLVSMLSFGVEGIAYSYAITNIVSTIVNIVFVNRIIPYSFIMQIKDLSKNLVSSVLMGVVVLVFSRILVTNHAILRLLVEISIGGVTYILLSFLLKNPSFLFVLSSLKRKIKKQSI